MELHNFQGVVALIKNGEFFLTTLWFSKLICSRQMSQDDEDTNLIDDSADNANDLFEESPNYPELRMGLNRKNISAIRLARSKFFEQQAKQLATRQQVQVAKGIEDEWKGILSLPELADATFDFQVLKQLTQQADATTPSNYTYNAPKEVKLQRQQLFGRQRLGKIYLTFYFFDS